MTTAASNYGVLSAAELAGLNELYDEETFHEFPIQALFGEGDPCQKERVIIDVVENVRVLGKLHSARGAADESVLFKYTTKIAEHAYQIQKHRIDSETLRNLRMPGTDGTQSKREVAEADMAKHLFAMRRVISRTNENVTIQMLSDGTYTIEIDGSNETFSTGVEEVDETASTPWTTTSVNLPERFDVLLKAYKRRYGRYPDVVILPDNFYAEAVANNTMAKDLFYRHPELYTAHMGLDAALMEAARTRASEMGKRFNVLTTDTQYIDSNGTAQDLWPVHKLSFVGMAPGDLVHKQVQDFENNYQGGVYSWIAESDKPPRGMTLYTTAADLYMIGNKNAVTSVQWRAAP